MDTDLLEHIALPKSIVDGLWDATRTAYPFEACGLLSGFSSKNRATATSLDLVPNRVRGINGFAITRQDIEDLSKSKVFHPIALFHSHRQTAAPSQSDIEAMRQQPLIWVIAASGNPPSGRAFHLRAFIWRRAGVMELDIKEITDDNITDACTSSGKY